MPNQQKGMKLLQSEIKRIVTNLLLRENLEKNLIILIGIVCVICFLYKLNYFNVLCIAREFIQQFKKLDEKYDKGAMFVSFVIPVLLGLATILQEKEIDMNMLNGITLIITVLTALFFTVIGLIIELRVKVHESNKDANEKKKLKDLCNFVFNADMFEILLCIFLLICCFVYMLGIYKTTLMRFLIYFLSYAILINILMLLKRLYVIIRELMK